MDVKELLKNELDSGQHILTKAVEIFNEDEFHAHLPGPGVSANWVLGHLAVNEDWFLSILTPAGVTLSADVIAMYQEDRSFLKEAPRTPSYVETHPPKAALVELFLTQRQRVLQALEEADVATWDQPAPEGMPPIFSTVGAVWGVIATHQYWHIGQVMSIRHMLAKGVFEF